MKPLLSLIVAFCFLAQSLVAQDTTKALKHEVGFSSLFLVRQLLNTNPGGTLEQLPYDVYYNYYFSEKTGLRLGLGILSSNTKTDIEGQTEPRTTKRLDLSSRAGLTFNIVTHRRVTINTFVDVLYNQSSENTVNTMTTQIFPNPVQTRKTETKESTGGIGGQVGMGVKFNLFRNISIYTELPLSMISGNSTVEVVITQPNVPEEKTKSKVTSTVIRMWVPATLYLVLRF